MRAMDRADSRVHCRAPGGHTVTVFLQPRSSGPLTEAEIEDLRRQGIPEDALFYRGPDIPTIGNRALPRPGVAVSVYDSSYRDNRRYSDAYGLQRDIEIAGRFVRTGTDFVVSLRRHPAGRIEVVDLR